MFPASVDAALAEFTTCVEQAATLTTPDMIPDVAVRALTFDALVENCEEFRDNALTFIALKAQQAEMEAEIAAMTERLIRDTKAELGTRINPNLEPAASWQAIEKKRDDNPGQVRFRG